MPWLEEAHPLSDREPASAPPRGVGSAQGRGYRRVEKGQRQRSTDAAPCSVSALP